VNAIRSKQRVADHGEVFTPAWIVEAMLNLVKDETERIDSRFLEPACGSGNFLVQILRRKLGAVELKYGKSDFERRHYALLALMCIYGIELLADNIAECRASVLEILAEYLNLDLSDDLHRAASYVLSQNLVHGDTLTMRTREGQPITFAEWGYVGKGRFQRRDFRFDILTQSAVGSDMQFDVIIGNPPYQLGSDGGTRDVPIYQHFIEQAKMIQPRYLVMVIPSRWMASGLGLSEFRQTMLGDRRIRELVDYPAADDVFPGVEVKAGVCYFLWDAAYEGDCKVTTFRGGEVIGPIPRQLGEYDVFVRDARAVLILHKVLGRGESPINTILARDKEFGWTSNFDGFHEQERPGDLPLYYIRKMKRGVGHIARKAVTKSDHLIDTWKLLVPEAFNGGDSLPHQIVGKPLIAPAPSVCTQSFLFFYVGSRAAAKSLQSYYATRFFRFLVSLRKITQHATHSTYAWVPMQTWNRTWTDEDLYAKYGITREEQGYIESQVRAMHLDDGGVAPILQSHHH
jgi:hypothetical protein